MLDPIGGQQFETFDPYGDHSEVTIAALYSGACGEPDEPILVNWHCS